MLTDGYWLGTRDGDPRVLGLYLRHYSSAKRSASARLRKCVGPGENIVLLTDLSDAVFVWRREKFRIDAQTGINCAIFRNEGQVLSSVLIREADELADERWPGERHFTFVDASKVRKKRDPGRCFLKAGWRRCGTSRRGLVILERLP